MSLTELWKSARKDLEEKHIQQIISFAGSGRLLDDSDASNEFRSFLSQIPSYLLQGYATQCLEAKFEDKGLALQDIVNEVGVRLGFNVERGRYRGTPAGRGFDGAWSFPSDSRAIIVEVKTSDLYRISLDTLVSYRREVQTTKEMSEDTLSVLIVVGSGDTTGLEAQIRGSRYAWDIRLISVDALFRLLRLKEEAEDPTLLQRIQRILIPREFTRLDEIIEVAFAAAQDVKTEEAEEGADEAAGTKKPKFIPVKFHDECIKRVQTHLNQPLVKKTRSIYSSPDGALLVCCMVSREHGSEGTGTYWFAFHPHQKESLSAARESYVALGCGSEERILLVPTSDVLSWLEGLNTTTRDDRSYWHISVFEEDGQFTLHRKKGFERIPLTKYLI